MVKRFADRYFHGVNSLYARPKKESLPMLIWDAYRNGGLHNYFPKRDTITTAAGHTPIVFGLSWFEALGPESKHSLKLDEMQAARAAKPAMGGTGSHHLAAEIQPTGTVSFWVCAPMFALELIDAGDKWVAELEHDATLQGWFVDGAETLYKGLKLDEPNGSKACLTSIVNAALAAAIPAPASS
jgi:hypothetical protein